MVAHIVGNRPQFIKLAPVLRALDKKNFKQVIIHTGQHYDKEMSQVFFEELEIPEPVENLNIGSGTHAEITAKAMLGIEKVLIKLQPEIVVVYGDTNSTLAAALVAAKLQIPVFHVEAGPRTHNFENPEEQNRIVVDHLSEMLFTPDEISKHNLLSEGIDTKKIIFSGDVMYDEFLYVREKLNNQGNGQYALLTWHRQENTSSKERMLQIINFLKQIDYPIIFPLHPRTKKKLEEYGLLEQLIAIKDMKIVKPVGYFEMVKLLDGCKFILSDSGGTSKESAYAGKKCYFLLNLIVWPQLIDSGNIQIVDFERKESVALAVDNIKKMRDYEKKDALIHQFFGKGNAAEIIAEHIQGYLTEGRNK